MKRRAAKVSAKADAAEREAEAISSKPFDVRNGF